MHLVDLIAENQTDLLNKLDGFQVKGPKAQTLHTANLTVVNRDMPFQYDLLELLVNPTIAYLLLTARVRRHRVRVLRARAWWRRACSARSRCCSALFGTAQLPVNASGVVLFIAAIVLFVSSSRWGATPCSRWRA